MRKKTRWLTAAAVVTMLVTIALFAGLGPRRHPIAASPEKPNGSSERAKQPRGSTPKRTTATGSDVIDDRPFVEVRPELERRALAGDAAAARRLGLALGFCNGYAPISDERIEDAVVDTAARGTSVRQNDHELSPQEMLSMLKLGVAQKNRECRGISGLDDRDAPQKAFQWIERAAALGDADAQALYSKLAFTDYSTRTALADAERIRERKQLAMNYLQASLAQGDAMALLQLSSQYDSGLLYQHDAETAYAYLYAYSLTTRAPDVVPALLEQLLAMRAAALDPDALERARSQGLQLASCCEMSAAQPRP